jgi:hypothetical protein
VRDTPEVRRLDQALVDYNHSEDADRMVQGEAVSGYSGGGPVSPFLAAEVNGRLPDPHNDIVLHQELDALAARIFGDRLPGGQPVPKDARIEILERTTEDLGRMVAKGPLAGSPEAWFLAGEAWYRLGEKRDGDGLHRAAASFLRAFELGRKDTQTLVRACGADAMGHEEEALGRLEDLAKQVPALGCQYWLLRARLIKHLESKGLRPAGSTERACKEAEDACRASRDRATWKRTCR